MDSRELLNKTVMAFLGSPLGHHHSDRYQRQKLQIDVVNAACNYVEATREPYAYVYEVVDHMGHHEIMITTAANRWATLPHGWTEHPLYR